MRRWLGHGVNLFSRLIVLTAVCVAVVWVGSFLVEHRSATPWPSWLPAPAAGSSFGTYLRIDVEDGQFVLAQVRPMDEADAHEHRLNPFPLGGYRTWNFGIVPSDGVWYPLGATTLWRVSAEPWPWVLGLCVVAVVLSLVRRMVSHWMIVKRPSSMCLHCGKGFTDEEQSECEQCGKPRPLVTVSSM